MIFNRRKFLFLFFARPARPTSIQVAVLETFAAGRDASAALVHHADDATRDAFARWLQANPKTAIQVRDPVGHEMSATIFRVRMCFGRGLIVFEKPIRLAEREILTVRTVD